MKTALYSSSFKDAAGKPHYIVTKKLVLDDDEANLEHDARKQYPGCGEIEIKRLLIHEATPLDLCLAGQA